jgi:hypothetical protein
VPVVAPTPPVPVVTPTPVAAFVPATATAPATTTPPTVVASTTAVPITKSVLAQLKDRVVLMREPQEYRNYEGLVTEVKASSLAPDNPATALYDVEIRELDKGKKGKKKVILLKDRKRDAFFLRELRAGDVVALYHLSSWRKRKLSGELTRDDEGETVGLREELPQKRAWHVVFKGVELTTPVPEKNLLKYNAGNLVYNP